MNNIPTKKLETILHTDKNGFAYTTVSNDPYGVRTYILENGLTVFLAKNDEKPGIQTYIAVKTGSNRDPKDNTGLAHYLEHMMFKGTSKIGTASWEEESKILNEISDLFEKRKTSKDPEEKTKIYQKIDQLSQLAAKFAIPNEYDKLMSSIGASGTNAHTWLDETVYKNFIPKNELHKWLQIEKERFSELTLRLFHTELESVYEEFNRAQDNDGRLVNYALMELLFPTHPNGQQTTLGNPEHLKNPSMKAIHQYFDDYYVPNNMAMVLVGDLDYEQSMVLIEATFGQLKSKNFETKIFPKESPIQEVVRKTVYSVSKPRVQLAWRTESFGSKEARLAEICMQILSNNGEVGLLDLNLNQSQKVLRAAAFSSAFKQYGYASVVVIPKENQTLEEAENLALSEIDKIKSGDFPDWLLGAIYNDMKLQRLKSWDSTTGLGSTLYDNFIKERSWAEELQEMDVFNKMDKQEIIHFANQFFKENYVAVYKEEGENKNLIYVENPKITPIEINRKDVSNFYQSIQSHQSPEIKPEFIDYQKEIREFKIKDRKFSFVKNINSQIAQLNLLFPFGKDHFPTLELAFNLMDYLGTNHLSVTEIKSKFYQLGITHSFHIKADHTNIILSGLEENMTSAVEFLQRWFIELQPNKEIYLETVQTILAARAYQKQDKAQILQALVNYAKFGADSRMRDILSEKQLLELDVEDLVYQINILFTYDYELFYYGKNIETITKVFENTMLSISKEIPAPKTYPEYKTEGKKYFVDFDMVQAEMTKVAQASLVDPYQFGYVNVFNEYFGRGLSSIIFQELRESRSLAYSAYVSYVASNFENKHNYVYAYIGTQPDKLKVANEAIMDLMSDFPLLEQQFDNAKNGLLKQIAGSRITKQNIFFRHYNLKKLGIHHDLRQDLYQEISEMTLEKLNHYYKKEISNIKFNTAIIGKKELIFKFQPALENEVEELSLEQVFGY